MNRFSSFLLPAALALATGCGGRPSETPPAQSAQPAPAPPSSVSGPSTPRIYVSDEPGGRLVVLDPAAGTVINTLAVGKRPRGISVLNDGQTLLVALSGSPIAGPGVDESKLPPADRKADGIGVVDLRAMKVSRIMTSGPDPETFAMSPDEKTVYLSNEDTGEMSAVDVATGEIRVHVHVGEEPEGVAIRPDGRVVYVTSEGDGAVIAVDATSLKEVGRVKTGARPRGVIFTPDGALAFVTCENAGTVTVVDARKHKLSSTITLPRVEGAPVPPRPMGVALSPDGKTLYVTNGRARSISVIDVPTLKVTRTFNDIGTRPWGIGISADGKMLYTANGSSGDVSVVDTATGQVVRRIAVGGSPWGISVPRD